MKMWWNWSQPQSTINKQTSNHIKQIIYEKIRFDLRVRFQLKPHQLIVWNEIVFEELASLCEVNQTAQYHEAPNYEENRLFGIQSQLSTTKYHVIYLFFITNEAYESNRNKKMINKEHKKSINNNKT